MRLLLMMALLSMNAVARQDGAGLGEHLKVLNSLTGEFLTSLARDAISLRHLICEALGARGSRV